MVESLCAQFYINESVGKQDELEHDFYMKLLNVVVRKGFCLFPI